MGTRADFYVKQIDEEPVEHNSPIEWIASIAWDGYPEEIDPEVLESQNFQQYQTTLKQFLNRRNDVTYPEQGWPWPWESSAITDYVYLYDCNIKKVLVWYDTKKWYKASRHQDKSFYPSKVNDLIIEATYTLPVFNTDTPALGNRSGLIIIGR